MIHYNQSADVSNKVIYDELDIKTFWDNDKKAPVKEGYVFGGWFTENGAKTAENKEILTSANGETTKTCVPLTTEEIDKDSDNKVDDGVTAVAKFVPVQVLSVKTQNGTPEGQTLKTINAETISQLGTDGNVMRVRILTSLDSENYDCIGFKVQLGKKAVASVTTTYMYNQLTDGTGAQALFGESAKFMSSCVVTRINNAANADKIIYVTPYWVTKDGTTVEGLAEYAHIEDEYMGYAGVAVNVADFSESADAQAAAVKITLQGMNSQDELVKLTPIDVAKAYETGKVFSGMTIHCDPDGSVTIVGNVAKVDGRYVDVDVDGLYANIRFTGDSVANVSYFKITVDELYNMAEEPVEDVKAYDVVR